MSEFHFLRDQSFSYAAKTKEDGSIREAGRFVKFMCQAVAPSPSLSPVYEAIVKDENVIKEYEKRINMFKNRDVFKCYFKALGKNKGEQVEKIEILGFV